MPGLPAKPRSGKPALPDASVCVVFCFVLCCAMHRDGPQAPPRHTHTHTHTHNTHNTHVVRSLFRRFLKNQVSPKDSHKFFKNHVKSQNAAQPRSSAESSKTPLKKSHAILRISKKKQMGALPLHHRTRWAGCCGTPSLCKARHMVQISRPIFSTEKNAEMNTQP